MPRHGSISTWCIRACGCDTVQTKREEKIKREWSTCALSAHTRDRSREQVSHFVFLAWIPNSVRAMERPKSNKNKWMERSESISLFRHRWVNLSTRFEIYLAVRCTLCGCDQLRLADQITEFQHLGWRNLRFSHVFSELGILKIRRNSIRLSHLKETQQIIAKNSESAAIGYRSWLDLGWPSRELNTRLSLSWTGVIGFQLERT